MQEPLRPIPGTGDFQTAAFEEVVPIPLAFRDEDLFEDELEINPED